MKNIAIFYGGRSYEHDISIITAIQAMTYINVKKYKVYPIYMKEGKLLSLAKPERFSSYIKGGKSKIFSFCEGGIKSKHKRLKIDCALLCTHGGEGENGVLQSVLEYYGIPYTSPNATMSAVCMDKWLSKCILKELGANVLSGYMSESADEIQNLGFPVIVKPVSLGSSIGIDVAHNLTELEESLSVAKQYDKSVIVERALTNCKELNCAVVKQGDNVIISAIERPIFWKDFLTFQEKYTSTGKVRLEKELPAKISDELADLVKSETSRIYKSLGLKGVVRMDYLYCLDEHKLYINEINTIPGSLAYYLFSKEDIPFEKLIDIMIEEGMSTTYNVQKEYKTEVLLQYVTESKGIKNKRK